MKCWIWILMVSWLCAPVARAQQDDEDALVRVELRVSETRPGGRLLVDRGARDGLAIGDAVLLRPASGGVFEGAVVEVEERGAVVELHDRAASVPPGTRGESLVPESRLARAATEKPALPTKRPWETDDNWTPGMPLLGEIEAVRPEDRPEQMHGRVYGIGDWTRIDGERGDSFLRYGADVVWDNPFGNGGVLHADGELNDRSQDFADLKDDESERNLRLDRLSYVRGGTRYEVDRWEVGRFLQYAVPEFGVVDGGQYTKTFDDGHQVGAALGFMPEPNADYKSGGDQQFSAYYRWIQDPTERVSMTAGYQRAWHNGGVDRDLFLLKGHYLPGAGWRYHGALWVDKYGSANDEQKDGFELTQAYLTASRDFGDGRGLNVNYSRNTFPETERDLFIEPQDGDLLDASTDRVNAHGWQRIAEKKRLHGRVGAWKGEDDSGGSLEAGVEFEDAFVERGRMDVTVFKASGEFSSATGLQLAYSQPLTNGAWDVFWEIANYESEDFGADANNLLQNRIRGAREFGFFDDWRASIFVEGTHFDDDSAVSLGFFVQRSF